MPVDRSRVTDLGPVGPTQDTSGIGEMLFENLKAKRASQQKIGEAGAIAEIEGKYQRESQTHANQLAQGLEQLRSQLRIQESDVTYQREQELRRQQAAGLEQLVGGAAQAGVPMPGLTRRRDEPEAGMIIQEPSPIHPGALEAARSAFATNLTKHFEAEARRAGLSAEAQKAALLRPLDLIDDSDARTAQMLAQEFEKAGDTLTANNIRALYGTVGQGSRTAWLEFQKTGVTKLETARMAAASKMAISKEITQRNKDIAALRAATQRATAQVRVDDKTVINLSRLHQGYMAQIAGLDRLHRRLQDSFYVEADTQKQIQLQSQMADIETEMRTLQREAEQITAKIREYTPARPEAAAPGAPPAIPGRARRRFNPATGRVE